MDYRDDNFSDRPFFETNAAFKMAWRPDEIVYVDWIGSWFASHFWGYFFQFFHNIYPPQSPQFGNPPLAMWLMTLGIWLAKKFGFSMLLGARLINALIGSFTAVYLFWFGRKWFSLTAGILAALFFSLVPVMVTNNGTAYLETLLSLLILISLELTFRYFQKQNNRLLYFLGLVLGLAFLTKFVVIPYIVTLLVLIPIFSKRHSKFWHGYFLGIVIMAATPFVLWAGMRDPQHLASLFSSFKTQNNASYPRNYSYPVTQYYYLMLAGILSPIISLGALVGIFYVVKNSIQDHWQQYKNLILIIVTAIVYLSYNGIFTHYGDSHQLVPILSLIFILAAYGLNLLIRYLPNIYWKAVSLVVIILILILPLIYWSPEFWGFYSSSIVGGTKKAFAAFNLGAGGEGTPEIAKYIDANTPKDSRLAVVAYDWLLPKYIENRNVTSLFLQEGIVGAMARGADYIVMPTAFTGGTGNKTAADLANLKPIYTYTSKNLPIISLYPVDYSKLESNGQPTMAPGQNWQMRSWNNTPTFKKDNNELSVDYNFTQTYSEYDPSDSRVLLQDADEFSLKSTEGLYTEVFGDGNNKLLSVLLMGDDKSYFEFDLICDWHGWKKVYIAPSMFQFYPSNPALSAEPNFNQNYSLDFGFLSRTPMKGTIQFRNIHLAIVPSKSD